MKRVAFALLACLSSLGGLTISSASAQEAERMVTSTHEDAESACLTEAVYREAGAEPMRGRLAVARVIINRTRSGAFPSSICGVTHQRGQFTFPKGLGPKRGEAEARLWGEARSTARRAIDGETAGIGEEALYFRPARDARAARGVRLVEVIGHHAFYARR